METGQLKILFLASDPSNASKLRLGKELQTVRNRLEDNPYFKIEDHWAVKPDDVIQTIVEKKPHIVHFSGHGQDTGELCFEDEQGNSKAIAPDALARLFELVKENVKCVIVNTCYAEKQAKAIAQHVPVVIGTRKEISDIAAIKFSTGFYTALNPDLSQNSLERAFKQGQIAIQFERNLSEEFTPILIFGSPEVRFSSQVDTAFSAISQPKGRAVEALIKGLSLTGTSMGLSDAVVKKILDEKIKKLHQHNESLIDYENNLKNILKDEYPLSEFALAALLQLQIGLNLRNEDVLAVQNKVLADPAMDSDYSWFDRGKAQYSMENFEKAIEYYSKSIEKNPEYAAAYFERGYAYEQIKKYDLAIADYTKSIECNKNWEVESGLSLAYFSRGLSYYNIQPRNSENTTKALQDWSKSIELNPNDPNAYYNKGLANQFLRNFDQAIADFKKSLEIDTISTNEVKAGRIANIVKCFQELGNQEEINYWTKMGLKYLDNDLTIPSIIAGNGNDK